MVIVARESFNAKQETHEWILLPRELGGTPLEPSGVVGNYFVSSHESRIYVCVGMAQDLLGGTYTFHRNNTIITIAIACP